MQVYVLFSFCVIVFSGRAESQNLNDLSDHRQSLHNLHRDADHIGRRGLSHNHNLYNVDISSLSSNSLRKLARQGNYNSLNHLRSDHSNRYLNNLDDLHQENYKLLLDGSNPGRQGRSRDVNLMSPDDYNLLDSALAHASRQGNARFLDHTESSEENPNMESRFSIGINAGINAGPSMAYPYGYPVQAYPPMYGVPVYG